MEAYYPYAIKKQGKAGNAPIILPEAPSGGLWVP